MLYFLPTRQVPSVRCLNSRNVEVVTSAKGKWSFDPRTVRVRKRFLVMGPRIIRVLEKSADQGRHADWSAVRPPLNLVSHA